MTATDSRIIVTRGELDDLQRQYDEMVQLAIASELRATTWRAATWIALAIGAVAGAAIGQWVAR